MDERLVSAWARLPDYLGQHAMLSAAALFLGAALAVPLAVAASQRPRLRWIVLTIANTVQTIPSLALLALFYPLLLLVSSLTSQAIGLRFSAFGFLPALLALTLYSMLPILRNVIAGLAGVDRDVVEAARGVGMTQAQSLFRIELPLAAPVILAGVRTSAVWVIGAATLSTPIGQTSLGNYIFTGLQTENWVFVLFGCAAAAVLAMTTDQFLGLIEAGLSKRDRRRTLIGAVGLAAGALLAITPAFASNGERYQIGGKTFTEQYILARLLSDRLEANGMRTERRAGLGSAVALRALSQGDIDVYVDYSGTIWTNAMGRKENPGREAIGKAVRAWLKDTYGVAVVGELGFENTYALAMARMRANELSVKTISDLAPFAPRLRIGGDYEFFARPEWRALQSTYGLRFSQQKQFQSTFMYGAAAQGEVDVISAFSTDGRIARYDLAVLGDDRRAIPPYDAIILVSPKCANDERLRRALTPLVGAISADAMRKANGMVDSETNPMSARAAAGWLGAHIAMRGSS